MAAVVREDRQRWGVAVAVGTLVMAGFIPLVNFSPAVSTHPVPVGESKGRPTVKIARPDETDTLLKEEAELRDLRPLFLPTDRNAALPDPKLEPGRTVLDSDRLKRSFAESDVQLGAELPPVATVGGRPAAQASPIDALDAEGADPGLLGIGRRETANEPFPPRGAFLEVTALSDGRRVWAERLPSEAGPASERPWNPLEIIAAIDRSGLTSPLIVTEGSRIEEVDLHFKNYLTNFYRIGERLNPGIYRIVVAP